MYLFESILNFIVPIYIGKANAIPTRHLFHIIFLSAKFMQILFENPQLDQILFQLILYSMRTTSPHPAHKDLQEKFQAM